MPQTSRWHLLGLYTQAVLYSVAGLNHLWHPVLYRQIMPDHYTHPAFWVTATGWAEIAGGLGLLLPRTRRPAAVGIVLMLLGYFDVHVFMLHHAQDRFAGIPYWALVARLPLQVALIAWAWHYARATRTSRCELSVERNGELGLAEGSTGSGAATPAAPHPRRCGIPRIP